MVGSFCGKSASKNILKPASDKTHTHTQTQTQTHIHPLTHTHTHTHKNTHTHTQKHTHTPTHTHTHTRTHTHTHTHTLIWHRPGCHQSLICSETPASSSGHPRPPRPRSICPLLAAQGGGGGGGDGSGGVWVRHGHHLIGRRSSDPPP